MDTDEDDSLSFELSGSGAGESVGCGIVHERANNSNVGSEIQSWSKRQEEMK